MALNAEIARLSRDVLARSARRGRGAPANRTGRFEAEQREPFNDGWTDEEPAPTTTIVAEERARTIISRNTSPDIPFDRSINPYRGCEHGCAYCYARPSHAYLGLSPGVDFESRLFAKFNAAELLEQELGAPNYQCRLIALGANTDPYQPIERNRKITRAILEVLHRTRHPVGIVTKSDLVTRDLDLLVPMARDGLVRVAISVTTLDRALARALEPRAPTPEKRLAAIRTLAEAGVPVTVLFAPVIPAVNDHELEAVLEAACAAGATAAGTVLLRLPLELRDLMRQWLLVHRPNALRHVLSLVQSAHGGKDYDARFGVRQTGTGPFAELLARRLERARARLGFKPSRMKARTDLFRPPVLPGGQMSLFDDPAKSGQ